jgi:hypothetical protein
MEFNRAFGTNGRELGVADWNVAATYLSVAVDYLIAELFRPAPFNASGSGPFKGVVPYGFYGSNGVDPQNAGIVRPTGLSSPTLEVYPFRAIIGSLFGPPSAAPSDAWRGIRSVMCANHVPGLGLDTIAFPVDIAATVANNRIDLVYAQVSLSTTTSSETRYERDPSTGVVTHPTVTTQLDDTFNILVQTGVEGASPALPSLPADGGDSYYIPLAYVHLVHPFFGTMSSGSTILEVAPVIPIARGNGVASLQPGNKQYDPAGAMLTATPFALTRPETYIPPTMFGSESRVFAFRWDSTPKSPAVNTTVTIDDTVDWRKRLFKWHVYGAHNAGAAKMAWAILATGSTTNIPSSIPPGGIGVNYQIGMGQSFATDLAGIGLGTGCGACVFGSGASNALTAVSTPVIIWVDTTDGFLKLTTGGDPGANVFVWLEASGPFPNSA